MTAPHVLIVEAPYYAEIAAGLLRGARRVLDEAGATHEVVRVAGAFELPGAVRLALKAMARAGGPRWDGFVALGCVVRGETDHYDHICREAARGIMDLTVQFGAPVAFGVLTVDDEAQAEARARDDEMNKGAEAARAVLVQIALARGWGV
ncbi:6,7-dimethyl-8-ribityllumazine synthase [Elioraea sp. Yellowstone]|uniref:6,7-dimethyl-8-ribityllumazine synthase n=1 Tax=Elioraea sp. Yellowstone TaxID=2592070 RepID=UPI001150BB43|nr:6,7-dimethyl-8-ribityllumazine synthase [Elioraea sp. Yellowstone]TQF84864.1 6,7-dimethyl-8-ribityllumazine synthase [Elioraea sp. Yellowstone]